MRLINFNTLSIQNFLSVGSTPVVVNFQDGVNVITGVNHDKEDSKNGVGKSTIVDALYFALFGNTIRELSKEFIVNSYNKKGCEVTLCLSVQNNGTVDTYCITRTLMPTKCFVTKNNVDVTHSTLAKTNEYIQNLIRTNGKIFQNSVVMTINNTVPFMAQSKIDKRKFIESILNLEVFSEMLLKVREEYNDTKREFEVVHAKNQTIEKNYNINKQQLEIFEKNKNEKIANIERKINENISKIEAIKKDIHNVPSNVEELFENKINTLNSEIKTVKLDYKTLFEKLTELKTSIKHLDKQLKDVHKVGSICTTCNRPYTEDDLKHKELNIQQITEKINKIQPELLTYDKLTNDKEEDLHKKENELNEISKKRNKVQQIQNSNSTIVSKIDFLTKNNNELVNELDDVKNSTNELLENSVTEFEKELAACKQQIDKHDNMLSVLECVKFIVSEEGVKSYIVRKILKVLNSRLSYYLEALQANCLCTFDEYFDECITDEKGVVRSYFNFSGGERKRIDLACLFAFLDIRRMQGDVHFSTIFYDELLDSSLDDKGVELVLRVLIERMQKYKENCYIVTHRGTAITSKVNNTVFLEKRNGFTYILE